MPSLTRSVAGGGVCLSPAPSRHASPDDFASRMGVESGQMADVIQGITQEFSEQARRALGMER
jgi:hypothetical protein